MLSFAAGLGALVAGLVSEPGDAQSQARRGRQVPVTPLQAAPATQTAATAEQRSAALDPMAEAVQADVSTRNVAVTSSFTGTEIVVFGAVENSKQPSAESGLYDVVIVIEGVPNRLTLRRKSRVGGIWLNTTSATFEGVPSYYAIGSTRPLDEIASEATMIGYEIGFDHIRMNPVGSPRERLSPSDQREFREALVRLKRKEGLYVQEPYGVAFTGRSLFRATIALPANVSVGPFDTRVYLFRQEKLLSQYTVRLNLERAGVERFIHEFALSHPFWYGIATVMLAVASGLLASTLFARSSH
ncbi:MAG: TIGR02186 family protein [Hyphomicrobiales bacterium]|nr:TIGR02186 family protein [Hyphomicrobiales bacterium]